jgi:hypothetical protein
VFLENFYHQHCENIRMLEIAISTVQSSLRDSIRKNEKNKVDVFTRLLAQLVSSWIEVRVLKLIYEPNAFTDDQITEILKINVLNERWKKALLFSYSKSFKILDPSKIQDKRYDYLTDLIKSDFLESNQIRNRLAHGQWKYAFNKDLTAINNDFTDRIENENIMKLQIKLNIFKDIAQIIHDLTVSKPTFDRDFSRYFNRVKENKNHYENRCFEKYKENLINSHERGKRSSISLKTRLKKILKSII